VHTRSWPTSLITTSLALVLAAPAQAGTITLRSTPPDPSNRYDQGVAYWIFTAATGERNDIVVETVPGGVRVTDTAALPTGCPADGPSSVVCLGDDSIAVGLGDGDDRLLARDDALLDAQGGPGDDHLTALGDASLGGGTGDDLVEGGPGEQFLGGGPGRDVVRGGAGRDFLDDGDGDPDQLDGGPDENFLHYRGMHGIRVDLARGRGPGGDVLANINNVEGTDGADVLIGDARDNTFNGGKGDDRIEGGGGSDRLDGEEGKDVVLGGAGSDGIDTGKTGDRVDGGAGNDALHLWFFGDPEIRCGSGRDTVDGYLMERGVPRLHRDCETFKAPGPIVRITKSRISMRWNTKEYRRPCRVRATVDGRTTLLRTFNGVTLAAPDASAIQLRPSRRCKGSLGSAYSTTAFRLVGP